MAATIRRIDWTAARQDVQRFLPLREQDGLNAWGVDFFLHFLLPKKIKKNGCNRSEKRSMFVSNECSGWLNQQGRHMRKEPDLKTAFARNA